MKRGARHLSRQIYGPFFALAGFVTALASSGHAELPVPSASGVQNASSVQCVPYCTYRGDDGKCRIMSSNNYCETSATCVPRCTYRGDDGKCKIYGPDFCGPQARCVPTCTLTQPDGTCALYAGDQCTIGYPFY